MYSASAPPPPVEFWYGPQQTFVQANAGYLSWFHQLLTVQDQDVTGQTHEFFSRYSQSFLTGHLHYLEDSLQRHGVQYTVHGRPPTFYYGDPDSRILSTRHHPDFILKPYQISTARKMVMGRRGGVQLATGAGKTASYLAALKWLELLQGSSDSLTVVTVTNLANQMIRRMKNAGLDAALYGSSGWQNASHVVGVVNGLHRAVMRRDQPTLQMLNSRKVLCLDEAHHGSADMCFNLSVNCPAEYRWMLSATLYANKRNPYAHPGDMRIIGISGPTLTSLPAKFLWEFGHVPKPTITFVPMLWPDSRFEYVSRFGGRRVNNAVWRGDGEGGAQVGVEWDLIVNNEYRNEFIRRYAYWRLLRDSQSKIVILVQRIDHGKILQRLLARVGVLSTFCYGGSKVSVINEHCEQRDQIDRSEKSLADFDTGVLRCLIGSSKFDEGQSFPLFSDLILAQAGKGGEANRRVYQRVGRGLHSGIPVRVVDFYDRTHRMVERQAETRMLALFEEDYPVQVDMPPECTWQIPGL